MSYVFSILYMIIYLIPGFQAESNGLSTKRDANNKIYIQPLAMDLVFGLTIIAIFLYTIAIVYVMMMVQWNTRFEASEKIFWAIFIPFLA